MFRAWVIWLLSAIFMCYKYAIEVSPSVMANDLMKEFSLTGAEMGNLASSYFYAYMIMQIPAGILIDRWGARKVTTVAIILCAIGALLFSRADGIFIACVGRFIMGTGAAFAAINCLKLVANWFPTKRFAFMAGLMMTVGMLGAVGGQAPLSQLISHLGWRGTMEVWAIGGAILMVLFFLIVRDQAPRHRHVDLIPERPPILKNLRSILRNPQAWYLSFYSGFAFAPVSAFGGLWGIPFLKESFHLSTEVAARGSSLIFIGFAVGAPIFGWISDRIRKRCPVMYWGTIVATLSLATVLYVPSIPLLLAYFSLFIFGFAISSFLLCFTMIKEIHYAALAATSISFMNGFDSLFVAASNPLTGKLLDLCWEGVVVDGARSFSVGAYRYSLFILVVFLVFSLIFLRFVKENHCKQVYPTGMP